MSRVSKGAFLAEREEGYVIYHRGTRRGEFLQSINTILTLGRVGTYTLTTALLLIIPRRLYKGTIQAVATLENTR